MPERLPDGEARELAGALVGELRRARPGILLLEGVVLADALEQQLFFALRDGGRMPTAAAARLRLRTAHVGRLAAAAIASAVSWRAPHPGARPIVALIAASVHVETLLRIEGHMQERAGEALTLVRVGRAAAASVPHAFAPRLGTLLDPALVPGLLAHVATLGTAMGPATAGWRTLLPRDRAAELRTIATDALGRIALGSTGLGSVARRWQPALLVAMDEVGTWARLLPAVGHRYDIPSLDLPHAEATDPIAIRGAGYDRLAVYGPKAATVMAAAGIGPERVTQIGAPRFDPLIAAEGTVAPSHPCRVVFAAQYLQRAMTRELLDHAFAGAIAAGETLAPAEVVVVPHPAEQPGLIAGIVAARDAPAGVSVRLAAPGTLHAELPGATLLVTGWSMAILEAAICGVPAIMVVPAGVAPVDFSADGLALSVADPASTAAAARSLQDPAVRADAISRARLAVVARLGPLDGRASERAARIMLEMAGRITHEVSA
jgi:hypothetical protein